MASSVPPVAFNFSTGRAFVQDGLIYYSPNCSRRVVIPPYDPLPFRGPDFDLSHFTQPAWWSPQFGWRSFIPLSPSFISLPFEKLCWMPKIIEQDAIAGTLGSEKQFLMSCQDANDWMNIETRVVRAAESLKLKFGSSTSPPPLPSSFGFADVFKSLETAKAAFTTSRNWFSIWMGYLSFLIAQSESLDNPDSPLPSWHQHLLSQFWQPPWLDGLASSGVCSFDTQTLRAGVVFRWTYGDGTRPDVAWFYKHNIPLFFVWSRDEEALVSRDEKFAYLRPPNHLLQRALSFLSKAPNPSLAALVMRRFNHIEAKTELNIDKVEALGLQCASSYVMQVVTSAYRKVHSQHQQDPSCTEEEDVQHSGKDEAPLPFQCMLEIDEGERGQLFTHFKEFFSRREKRQAEILKVESRADRQRRESREKNPPFRKVKMFDWTRVETSGGQLLHMRVQVPQRNHERFHSELDADRRIYNAMANEWDIFSEFAQDAADDPIKTDYDALFADSPEYYMDYLNEITEGARATRTEPSDAISGPGRDDVVVTDSMVESILSDVIADAVANRRDTPTCADSRQVLPGQDSEDRPAGDVHDDNLQPTVVTDSFKESMPSNAASDSMADRRNTPTRADSRQGLPGQGSEDRPADDVHDDDVHDDGWQLMVVTDSEPMLCIETSDSVADRRDTSTRADSQQNLPGQDSEDRPADDDGWQPMVVTDSESMPQGPPGQDSCMGSMTLAAMPVADEEESSIFEHLELTYGYTNPLGVSFDTTGCVDWPIVTKALGLVKDPAASLSQNDMKAIRVFISRLSSQGYRNLPKELDTLNPLNHLATLHLFDFREVKRCGKNLFIFNIRCSELPGYSWILGVNSAAAALYVCRYTLTNPVVHNNLTVAHRLLKKGIPFHTLVLMQEHDGVEPLSAKTRPLSYRNPNYRYTRDDFEGSMLACKRLLQSPHGRAALLQGGIVGRIAQEFLSLDTGLNGPSVRVTQHRAGFVSPSHMRQHQYWDDDLTDLEIDVICGTYVLWTGFGQQTVTVSWFPPPDVWSRSRSGFRWLEWTERDEVFFLDILLDIHTGKHQPLRHSKWLNKLRGVKSARDLISNNEKRSQHFLDPICVDHLATIANDHA